MKALYAIFLAAVWAAAPAQAAAAGLGDIQPPDAIKGTRLGLWEETIESTAPPAADVDMSRMDMSEFTPEQKARIAAVLKRQHAEHVAQGSGPVSKTKSKQFCLKRTDITKSFGTGKDSRDMEDCKASEVSRTSSRVALRVVCAKEGDRVTTDIMYDVKSPTVTVTEMRTTGMMRGHAVDSTQKANAHWVGPDCGSVKSAHE